MADDEVVLGFIPLCATALYLVVTNKFVTVYVVVVFAIFVVVSQLSVDDSHLITFPICPDKVKVVLFVPIHTSALPATCPPIEKRSTIIIASAEVEVEQSPLLTSA